MQNVYKLREACAFHPYDGHAGENAFIVWTPENRQFKISPLARDILLQLDGQTTLDILAARLNSRSIGVSAEGLRLLMATKYHPLGIVEDLDDPPGLARETGRKQRLPFLLHWNLIPAKYVQAVSAGLTFMFSRLAVLLALGLILAAHYIVYSSYYDTKFLGRANSLHVLLLCLLSILWHEFGHSAAVSRYGGKPGKIGFGLFVLLPSFYADVSEIWRFSRKHRMVVDLGGVYFQQVCFAAFMLAGVLISRPEFFVACRLIDLMVLLTLNPVVQFDGYWLLSDWLALPNLYRLGTVYVVDSIKRMFVRGRSSALLASIPRHAHMVVVVYALLSNIFLVGIFCMSYRYISSTFGRAHTILPAILSSLMFALRENDLSLFANRLVALFFVLAFPATVLVGFYRYGMILARYCIRKVRSFKLV